MVKAVIFDFGGVICTFSWRRFFISLASFAEISETQVDEQVSSNQLVESYELGKISTVQFMDQISACCGVSIPKEFFIKEFTRYTPHEDIVSLLRNLQTQTKLGILSNTNELHAKYIFDLLHIKPLFTSITFSYKVGKLKPDPLIYKLSLEALGVDASEVLYIDDLLKNVEGAIAVGMKGLLYKDVTSLLEVLEMEGFDVAGLYRSLGVGATPTSPALG